MTPDEYTISEFFLDVDDGHQLYIQDWGNKKAKLPIIFLHGGPGGHCKDRHKGVFDPTRQRVIFFDQRGAGKSLPYGSLENNTTKHIVEDIEKIANHLNIKQFILTGGSWGSALALFYGLTHPQRVKAMVLSGIWTGSKQENDWIDKGLFKTFMPDAWEKYVRSVPKSYQPDPSSYHFPRILGDNQRAVKESGYAYENLEGAVIALDDRFTPDSFDDYDPAGIRIEVSYLVNTCFMPDRYILNNSHKLKMPIWLVQGRYDMVCPPKTAYELSQKIPQAELIFTISGHHQERESWNVIRSLLLQLSGATDEKD